jgi:UrcA family protein
MKSTTARKAHGPAKSYTLVAMALLAASLTANPVSASTPDNGPRQSVVNFSDLDLSRPRDAHRLYSRIKYAARQVCDNNPSSDLRLLRVYETCLAKAINDGVAQVQSVQLAAIHQADMRLSRN